MNNEPDEEAVEVGLRKSDGLREAGEHCPGVPELATALARRLDQPLP